MKNKKILPIAVFVIGLAVFAGLYFFVIRGNEPDGIPTDEADIVAELPFGQRPFASLTPTEDGHYLNLRVENIQLVNAAMMDYDLMYLTAENIQQGTSGSADIEGQNTFEPEKPILLGSDSAGNLRFDEGVEQGTLTLLFRDNEGRSIGKVSTQFHLLAGGEVLESLQQDFSYTLDDASTDYFVVMNTFGMPSNGADRGEPKAGPFGIFASGDGPYTGQVSLDGSPYRWTGADWESLDDGNSDDIGVFTGY